MKGRRKFRPLNVPTSTPTFDQIGRKFERRGFQTLNGGGDNVFGGEAWFERMGVVTSFALTDTGSESYSWTDAGADVYQYITETRAWSAGETAILNGVRWETHCPAVDDEVWNPSDGAYMRVWSPYLGSGYAGGVGTPGLSIPLYIAEAAAMLPQCVAQHYHQQKITGLQVPIYKETAHDLQTRPRYYRILHNGTPVTGILDACDPDDWSTTIGNAEKAVTGGFQIQSGARWDLPTPSSYRFTRGVTYGIDVWYEVRSATATTKTMDLRIGSTRNAFSFPTGAYSHGIFGMQVDTNPGFNAARDTYALEFTGGTWRPAQTSPSDDFTFGDRAGETIATTHATTLSPSNPTRDQLQLRWDHEIPYLYINLHAGHLADGLFEHYYIPEDDAGYIRTWNDTGTKYSYMQNPGGYFQHRGTTTFVPWFPIQQNFTGIFTDDTVTEMPTSITVTRTTQ